jgi:hypothetical protein
MGKMNRFLDGLAGRHHADVDLWLLLSRSSLGNRCVHNGTIASQQCIKISAILGDIKTSLIGDFWDAVYAPENPAFLCALQS